jgi:two-component system, OmpR family, sensor histidine kinase BaeS
MGTRIFISILSIALGALILVSILVNISINLRFENYIQLENRDQITNLARLIENNYQEYGNWNSISELQSNVFQDDRIKFYITDTNNNIIYSNHHGIISGQSFDKDEIQSLKLKTTRGDIGELHWYFPAKRSQFTEHEKDFASQVNRIIYITAAIISLISVIISFLISRRLTYPLLKMNKAVNRVANGELNHNLTVKGNDEIAELTAAFNKMVNKLRHLEKIREESSSDLAHELRTPVTNIKNYLEGIEDGILKPDQKTIEEIKEEIERLIKLINHIQDLTNVEEKITHLQLKKEDLLLILKNTAGKYKIKARKDNIKYNESYPSESIYIEGDKDSLETIFNNLISNAIKYTDENGKINLELKKENRQAIFTIKNTGTGIPEEDLPFVFERFYQADKSRSNKNKGNGIGLTITKKLVQAQNGAIEVESNNKETKFTISFPTKSDS